MVVAKEFYALTGPPGEQEGTVLPSEPNATETRAGWPRASSSPCAPDFLTVLVPETNAVALPGSYEMRRRSISG